MLIDSKIGKKDAKKYIYDLKELNSEFYDWDYVIVNIMQEFLLLLQNSLTYDLKAKCVEQIILQLY